MILQSLYDYYERARKDSSCSIPPYGYAQTTIFFVIELDPSGQVRDVLPLSSPEEKKRLGIDMQTPFLGKARSSGVESNFLWDNPAYVFGVDGKGKTERALEAHAAFVKLHEQLLENATTPALKAVLAFIRSWRPENARSVPLWEKILGETANSIAFKLSNANSYAHDCEEAQNIWRDYLNSGAGEPPVFGRCLITGEGETLIAKLHPPLKGVRGAQSSGAGLSTYNMDAVESFGKEQNYNAPVGQYAAIAYATALNSLLENRERRLILGDSTIIAWADEPSDAEAWILQIIDPPQEKIADKKNDDEKEERRIDGKTTKRIREILEKLVLGDNASGEFEHLNQNAVFHLLCLAPNSARLAVRFHLSETLEYILKRIGEHYSQLDIDRNPEKTPKFISVYSLAKELAGKHKKPKDIQRLASDIVKSILTGQRYPQYLLAMLIDRMRAERNVTYVKAALLKAILIRNHKKEIPVKLDSESADVAYQLGRLFSLLESVQWKALGKLNATVRDKFYGAASSTPASVFPLLLKNAQNHISKANAYGYDKLIGETLSHINSSDGFPAHLTLERQGQFALGYYHQRYSGKSELPEAE